MRCPKCGKKLDDTVTQCPICKTKFASKNITADSSSSARTPQTQPKPAQNMRTCAVCGEPMDANASVCSKCGKVSKSQTAAVPQSRLINPALPVVTEYDDSFEKSSFEEVISAAARGNVAAIYELGSRYRLGVDGAPKDPVKAIGYYKEVLKYQNNKNAFYHIGYLYGQAFGKEHVSEYIPYYEAAMSLGDGTAATQIAIVYEFGEYIPQDLNRAIEYYDKAIELGNGNGTERDAKARVYEKLGRMDLAQKCWHETLEYYDRELQTCKHDEKTWLWREKGNIHKHLGDEFKAMQCYETALSYGDDFEAATSLGIFYEDGIPGKLDVDLKKAYYYYQLGYDTKPDDYRAVLATSMLARFLFFDKAGEGQDFRAFELFNEIRKLKSNEANVYLGYYYGMGIPGYVEINTDLAFKLLDDVPADEEVQALYYKGVICLKTFNDVQSARKYLESAAQRGSADAKSLLDSFDNPNNYVQQSQTLFSTGDRAGAFKIIVQAQKMFPNSLAVMRQIVRLYDDFLLDIAFTRKIQSADKDLCYLALDYIKKLRANNYETDGLSVTESDMYYCLGCIYHNENDIATALKMLNAANVDYTPVTAIEYVIIHMQYLDSYINELSRDASRLVQALNSKNWHTNKRQAFAYCFLSMIYAKGAPGIQRDVNYAYNCIQQCNALAPEVAAEEIKKYSVDYYGRIVYNYNA